MIRLMSRAAHQKFFEIFSTTQLCFAAGVVAELGIADLIPRGGTRSAAELAAASGCDESHLYRTLRLLASYGFFQETAPRSFALTDHAESLRQDAPESMRAAWRMFHRLFKTQGGLEEGLRKGGTPFEYVFGQNVFGHLSSHPDDAAVFDAGMTAIHGPETAAILEAYDFNGIETLADIGGGAGGLLIGTLSRYPKLKGLLFDLGHVIGRARANVAGAGLTDRCRVEEGNFFESIPSGADAYVMSHIIHDWTDEQSIGILKNVRRVIRVGGRLLLVEAVVPPGNERSVSKDLDFTMLMYPGGKERTEDEYRALFAASGFALHGITPTMSPMSVIEARPV
jgi:SAM-dependent methyltransferase